MKAPSGVYLYYPDVFTWKINPLVLGLSYLAPLTKKYYYILVAQPLLFSTVE